MVMYDNQGSIKIYLGLFEAETEKSIMAGIDAIAISWMISCDKTLSSCPWISKFVEDLDKDGWGDHRALTQEWNTMQDLSIFVTIKISYIKLNDNDKLIFWRMK